MLLLWWILVISIVYHSGSISKTTISLLFNSIRRFLAGPDVVRVAIVVDIGISIHRSLAGPDPRLYLQHCWLNRKMPMRWPQNPSRISRMRTRYRLTLSHCSVQPSRYQRRPLRSLPHPRLYLQRLLRILRLPSPTSPPRSLWPSLCW